MDDGTRPNIGKPELPIQVADLPATVRALSALLASKAILYDRGGVLVDLLKEGQSPTRSRAISHHNVRMVAHDHCQPIKIEKGREAKPVTLPKEVAEMFMALGSWGVPQLAGITTGPLLRDDGTIICKSGYDAVTQIFCDAPPDTNVPARPSRQAALGALGRLRETFTTFPFADAAMVRQGKVDHVDLSQPPGLSESSYLAAVLTAVCRPSLWTAPGLLIDAPDTSGSGSGKGLLAKAAIAIAFGVRPAAFTAGHARDELEKRLGTELICGDPAILLDNLNSTALRSDSLASALSERPARIRTLGSSSSKLVNSAVFIALTGNGLTVSEDLARRILKVSIDPRMEDPEARSFSPGFVESIFSRRSELLSAVLTIWRWGRQNDGALSRGLPLGGFETWTKWVRDPLLALGCADPVEGMRRAKQLDPRRRELAELFNDWWRCHSDDPVTASELHPDVLELLNPHRRPSQWVWARLASLTNTRIAGFVLTRSAGGKWSAGTYSLRMEAQRPDDPNGPNARVPGANGPEPDDPNGPNATFNLNAKKRRYIDGMEDAQRHREHWDHQVGPSSHARRRGAVPDFSDPAYRRMRAAEMAHRAHLYQEQRRPQPIRRRDND